MFNQVGRGVRPELALRSDAPSPVVNVMTQAWAQDPMARPSAEDIAAKLATAMDALGF